MFKQALETNNGTTGDEQKTVDSIAQIPSEYFTLVGVFSTVSASQSPLRVTDSTCYVMQAYSSAFAQQFTTLKGRMANLQTIVPR